MVIAKNPAPPVLNNYVIKNITTPSIAQTKENDAFELEEDCIKNCFATMTNLKEKDNDYMNESVAKIDT